MHIGVLIVKAHENANKGQKIEYREAKFDGHKYVATGQNASGGLRQSQTIEKLDSCPLLSLPFATNQQIRHALYAVSNITCSQERRICFILFTQRLSIYLSFF